MLLVYCVTVLAAVNTVAFASHLHPFFELSHARHHFNYMYGAVERMYV
jgi:hypothetical protein